MEPGKLPTQRLAKNTSSKGCVRILCPSPPQPPASQREPSDFELDGAIGGGFRGGAIGGGGGFRGAAISPGFRGGSLPKPISTSLLIVQ